MPFDKSAILHVFAVRPARDSAGLTAFGNKPTNLQPWLLHFLVAGALTSYFDLLTCPVVTFGVPIIFLLMLHGSDFLSGLRRIVACGLSWSFGYVGLWAGKWILASLFTDKNVIEQAIYNVKYRSGFSTSQWEGSEAFTYRALIVRNLGVQKIGLLLAVVLLAACVLYAAAKRTAVRTGACCAAALCALIPFGWYLLASNHAWVHYWMEYRTLAILVYAVTSVGVILTGPPVKHL